MLSSGTKYEYIIGLNTELAKIASQLALRRWPNVNPYVGPTSAHRRWANVDLSIGPTVVRQRCANIGPTLAH